MPKVPKFFALKLNEHSIGSLEELRANFSCVELLDYFFSKKLHKWLQANGYDHEYHAVSNINSLDNVEILRNLIEIFQPDNAAEILKKYTNEHSNYSEFHHLRGKTLLALDQGAFSLDDFNQYNNLIEEMMRHPNEDELIYKNVACLITKYSHILSTDFDYFNALCEQYCILAQQYYQHLTSDHQESLANKPSNSFSYITVEALKDRLAIVKDAIIDNDLTHEFNIKKFNWDINVLEKKIQSIHNRLQYASPEQKLKLQIKIADLKIEKKRIKEKQQHLLLKKSLKNI